MCNSWKRFVSVAALWLITANLTGCELVDKTVKILVGEETAVSQGDTAKPRADNQQIPRKIELTTPDKQEASGKDEPKSVQSTGQIRAQDNSNASVGAASPQVKLVLYFANEQGTGLISQQRETTKVTGLARRALEELLQGPQENTKVVTPIPKGTKLLDLNIKSDGLAIASFSQELSKNHGGGSMGETLTVYSIVNTLCQFPTVKHVQILIEGQKIDSLAGHIDLSVPLERDIEIVKSE